MSELQEKARVARLWESRTWRTLLHYRPSWGGWRSEADGLGFFLAGKRGKTDPRGELEATLAALAGAAPPVESGSPEASQHPQCRFPARWAFLKKELGIDPAKAPDQPCPLFTSWRQSFAAEKVTLVYATAYLNSPASMYGHTFFRVSRATGEGNSLLDYVINFAADIDTDNGLVYAVKGTMGGFRGFFYVMPHYVKIQEYSHMESRDIWEYELRLQPEEIERLVQHAWETRSTHFDYYFFSENCSYFLLGLLEAARPSLDLRSQFSGWVIPSDTVRAVLAVPGLVGKTGGRPSLRASMLARKKKLTGAEVKAAEDLADHGRARAPDSRLPRERQALLIDAAYDRLRYKEGFKAEPSAHFARVERDLLVLRGRTGVPPLEIDTRPEVDAPERGHATFQIGVAAGVDRRPGATFGRVFEELSLRPTIHDLLDAPFGYPEDAALEMGHIRFRYDNRDHAPALSRADLVQIVSLPAFDRWAFKPAWRVWMGGEQLRALGCDGWRCLTGGAVAGTGLAARLGWPFLAYAMVESDIRGGPIFDDDYRLGLGGSVGATLRLTRFWRAEGHLRALFPILGDRRRLLTGSAASAWDLTRHGQMRIAFESSSQYQEGRLELHAYF